jgi:phage terminase large subunit
MMKLGGSNLLVVRKVYKDHKDSTYAQLKWAIRRLQAEKEWEARLAPLEIVYKPTGQKVLFRGLDDPLSITSITVDVGHLCWAWFEEAFQISSEKDFDMVDGSIRGQLPEHLYKQITLTLNPWNEKHWIKKRFFDTQNDDVFALQNNYLVNEFLDEQDLRYFEKMKELHPRRYWVEGLGNWGRSEGLILDNWIEQEFDWREVAKEKHIESCFGLDFGYTADPSGFICSLIDTKNRKIYVFDEHYEKGMLNDDIAEMIIRKGYSKELITADSAEPKSIAEIKKYGISRIRGARKGKDSVINGIQFLQQFQIVVHPRCVNVVFELNNYAWDTREGKIINKPIDDFNHLIDPLRYSVEKYSRPSSIRFFNSRKTK